MPHLDVLREIAEKGSAFSYVLTYMGITPEVLQHLRDVLDAGYPGLKSFADPRFRKTETDYKREAASIAQTWFSKTALEALLENEPEELTNRVRGLANKTNLLFLGVPREGDLALLYRDDLDSSELGDHLLDLLHNPATHR